MQQNRSNAESKKYLFGDNVRHRDVLTIPMCGDLRQHFRRNEILIVREIVSVHDGSLGEHDGVYPTPPSVLPVQVALVARNDVICVHSRGESNQNTVQVEK